MEVDVVRLASEFPNDNPALHCGVIWVCPSPTSRALPVLPVEPRARVDVVEEPIAVEPPIAFALAADAVDEAPPLGDEIVVEELEPIEALVEGEHASEVVCAAESSAPPPSSDDPFTLFVCTLADVAISAGSPHVASLLPGLLFDGRVPVPVDGDTAAALQRAGIWDGAEIAPSFIAVASGWRAILRGTSDDFDACGPAMLDEWSSELLARLLDAPGRAVTLRQELRSRGVAAFGLAA